MSRDRGPIRSEDRWAGGVAGVPIEPEVDVTSRPSEAMFPAGAGPTPGPATPPPSSSAAAAPADPANPADPADPVAGGSAAVSAPGPAGRRPRPDRRLIALVVAAVLVLGLGSWVLVRALGSGGKTGDAPPVQVASPTIRVDPSGLAWPPPALTDPETVVVDADNHNLELDPERDYRVVLPTSASTVLVGGVTISGGHNVVIIGGVINVPSRAKYPDKGPSSDKDRSTARRGMYLKGQTGTVHIEGVHLMGDLADGFNLDQRLGAVVQLENNRVDLVYGSKEGHHADVLQTWAGPRILRVDGLLAATQYQGLFLMPNHQFKDGPAPEQFVLRRTAVTMLPDTGYGLWLPRAYPWMDWSGLTLRVLDGRPAEKLVWPKDSLGVRVVDQDAPITLPAGTPGGNYTSPGYLSPAGN